MANLQSPIQTKDRAVKSDVEERILQSYEIVKPEVKPPFRHADLQVTLCYTDLLTEGQCITAERTAYYDRNPY